MRETVRAQFIARETRYLSISYHSSDCFRFCKKNVIEFSANLTGFLDCQ